MMHSLMGNGDWYAAIPNHCVNVEQYWMVAYTKTDE